MVKTDTNKYTAPNLPAAQHVMEDISDPDIIKADQPLDLSTDDDIVRNAYTCHRIYKQLETDSQEQSKLSSDLETLNEQLVDNIGNMKNQISNK